MGIKKIYGSEELSSIYIDARLVIFSCLTFTLRSDVLCLASLAILSSREDGCITAVSIIRVVVLLQFWSEKIPVLVQFESSVFSIHCIYSFA